MNFGIKADYMPRPKARTLEGATREVLKEALSRADALAEADVSLGFSSRLFTDDLMIDVNATGQGPLLRVFDHEPGSGAQRVKELTIEENPVKRAVSNLLGQIPFASSHRRGTEKVSLEEAVSLLTESGFDPEFAAKDFNGSLAVHNGETFMSGDDFFSRSK